MKLDFLKNIVEKAGGMENIINEGMKMASGILSKDDKQKASPSETKASKKDGLGNILTEGMKIASGLMSEKGKNKK